MIGALALFVIMFMSALFRAFRQAFLDGLVQTGYDCTCIVKSLASVLSGARNPYYMSDAYM